MATNKVYVNPGAITAFLASTATIAPTGATSILWTPQNTAVGHGRISAVWDRGSGAHPLRYTWRMRTQWNATAGNGDELRLYIVQADAAADPTQTDGGITFGDADTTNENPLLYNALYLGCIMSNGASHPESTSGLVYLSGRYVGVAAWNGAGSQALVNTANDHMFTLTELPDEVEAAS
jgi:hypothetical protein